jgi:hypothetical protein
MKCRSCHGELVQTEVNLGIQASSGVFPESTDTLVSEAELKLFHCQNCRLVQLGESLPQESLLGEGYGYRSGLNQSMVDHLKKLARYLSGMIGFLPNNQIIDIGANDGTFLRALREVFSGVNSIAVDPTLGNWSKYYDFESVQVPEFFTKRALLEENIENVGLITSIAMLYDLPSPLEFIQDVFDSLAPGGYWFTEQSYLPEMIRLNSYDTICHEHLEYYSLTSLEQMTSKVGFRIRDVRFSNSNGGAIGVLLQKPPLNGPESSMAMWLLKSEATNPELRDPTFGHFAARIKHQIADLSLLIETLNNDERARIVGYGASTKGNTILQAAGLDHNSLLAIEEINPQKYGHFTPKTHIPICDQNGIDSLKPTHKLVLPWHFRESIISREATFLKNGGKLIFPLPRIDVVAI